MSRFLPALFLLAIPACGGHIILDLEAPDGGRASSSSPPPSSSSPSPSNDDSGSGQSTSPPGSPFPVCPGMQPQAGSPCPTQGQGCAYVDLTAGTCESWTCSSSSEWVSSTPAGC